MVYLHPEIEVRSFFEKNEGMKFVVSICNLFSLYILISDY